ncbi:phosphoribosylamine--glycine ligase [Myxococcota bacterium]|nr:phosphoribosylamine--glycine ligase [Myxococcota bacterium]MBU1379409.1 phosphoribosylamine--glycine ligase [Myxococcota bacterium]MBU1495355.1 phosphoribosylamine--glycine ligase [Myxococcota bacterium]
MKVLVIGNGGREHALAWKISLSEKVTEVYVQAPLFHAEESLREVHFNADDHKQILDICRQHKIDLVVVGPERQLVEGIADMLRENGFPTFGPGRRGAVFEGSKSFTKEFLTRNNIPTAFGVSCTSMKEALTSYPQFENLPVVKIDSLAGGKGVFLPDSVTEMERTLRSIYSDDPHALLVLEERLAGWEVSIFALSDGKKFMIMPESQDYKRIFDNDKGPNTGGMGAVTPVSRLSTQSRTEIEEIMHRVRTAMTNEGIDYRGLLYAGFMVTPKGPKILEFNCRFGDPETQALLFNTESDIFPLLMACAEGNLDELELKQYEGHCVTVVLASSGYPQGRSEPVIVNGLNKITDEQVKVFHAGTQFINGHFYATGGRILNVTARGSSLEEARQLAYNAASLIKFKGMKFRTDIGLNSTNQ